MGVCCCLQTCTNLEVVLGGSWIVIPTMSVIQFFCRSFNVLYYGVCWCLHVKYIVYKIFEHMSGNKTVGVCNISDTYLIRCLRYGEKHGKDVLIAAGGFCCLRSCKSVINMLIMGLALRQSLMVLPTSYNSILPLYNVLQECLCCCLHVNYIFYKHLNTQVLISPIVVVVLLQF